MGEYNDLFDKSMSMTKTAFGRIEELERDHHAKQTNGQLTPQQAADLIQQTKAIQQAIGCSNIVGISYG